MGEQNKTAEHESEHPAAREMLAAAPKVEPAQTEAALADSQYAAGMLLGWNLCADDRQDEFNLIRGQRMQAACAALAAQQAAKVEPAEQAKKGGLPAFPEFSYFLANSTHDMQRDAIRAYARDYARLALAAQQAPAQPAGEGNEICPTCFATEPYTGTCGTSPDDTKALCRRVSSAQPPAKVEREALTARQLSDCAREAQIDFCMNKAPSFEVAFARRIEGMHGIPAPTVGEKENGNG